MRELLDSVDAATLAEMLIAGVTRSELALPGTGSLSWEALRAEEFVLDPLPNTLFQRDGSSWIYGGVTINPTAAPGRQRERLHSRAIYRFHPIFRDRSFAIYHGDADTSQQSAVLEGGDVHVLGRGVVLIGMGGHSTPMAVELVAQQLFRTRQAHTVIAVQLPTSHGRLHLDAILTMVDLETFVFHPYLDPSSFRIWILTPAEDASVNDGELRVERRDDLFRTIGEALGIEKPRILVTNEDARATERTQQDDANNYLALAPGIVIGYERDTETNGMLRDNGIKVIGIPGSELGRGSGGTRRMTCPLERDGI